MGRWRATSCRALDLRSVANHLPENAVLVPQTVADGRVLQRRERVDEAGREPTESAVAEPGIRLLLDHCVEIPTLLLQGTAYDRVRTEIHHVVAQRAAEKKLHRQNELTGEGDDIHGRENNARRGKEP